MTTPVLARFARAGRASGALRVARIVVQSAALAG